MCHRNLLWDTAPAVCQKVSEKDAFTADAFTFLFPLKIFRNFCFNEKLPSATDLSNTQHFNPMDKNTVTGLVLIVLVLIGEVVRVVSAKGRETEYKGLTPELAAQRLAEEAEEN